MLDLHEGDVVAFPFATGHAMGLGEAGPLIRPVEALPPRPWADVPVLRYGDGPIATRLLCGFVSLEAMNFQPLRDALPVVMRIESCASRVTRYWSPGHDALGMTRYGSPQDLAQGTTRWVACISFAGWSWLA